MKSIIKAAALSLALMGSTNAMNEAGSRSMEMKQLFWQEKVAAGQYPNTRLAAARNARATCPSGGGSVSINGESFPCQNIDFEAFIPLSELDIDGTTTLAADIWGWYNTEENKEITLLCVDNGIWFIDTTQATNPVRLGYMPSGRPQQAWCDIKVYKNVAYVVKDGSSQRPTYGVEVFDLTRLVGLDGSSIVRFTPDFVYAGHGFSHNLVIDTESGFLYSVGTNTCSGGLHMISLEPNPLRPTSAGCVSGDGYTHDAQCVVYDGPDTRFTGQQICFAFNEDTLTIWDVTVKSAPTMLSRTGYSTASYTHQGWLTEDMAALLLNDELDEDNNRVTTTTTYFVDVSNLRAPVFRTTFKHPEVSIDHNLYVWGAIHKKGWGGNAPLTNAPLSKYAYLSNYVAGIKVLDISDPFNPTQAGRFDVAPDLSGNIFEGTWSNYMHPSGLLAVSSIDRGFFLLRPQMAFEDAGSIAPTNFPTPRPTVEGCADRVPSGLIFSDGSPAECEDIGSFCASTPIVRERCPETCGLCGEPCEDKVPSGLTYTDGSPAPCSDFVGNEDFYCGTYQIVQDACPRTCGLCPADATFLAKVNVAKTLLITLPDSPEDDGGRRSPDMSSIIVAFVAAICVALSAALVVVVRKNNVLVEQMKEQLQTEVVTTPEAKVDGEPEL